MKLLSVALLTSFFVTFCVDAKSDFVFSIDSSLIYSENKTPSIGTRSSNILTVRPNLGLVHSSRITRTSANIRHSYNEELSSVSGQETGNNKSNFTNFDINTQIQVLERVLTVNGSASQSYPNTSASNSLVNDQFFGNQDLSKTETYRAGFNLTLNRFDYVELVAYGNVANVKSDRQTNLNSGINSTDSNYNITLVAGEEFRYIDWNFTTNYAETNGSSLNDSVTESYVGNIYIGLIKRVRLVVTGSIEKNDFSSENLESDIDSNTRNEYKTAGLGLSYNRDRSRFFDLTYNISSRTGANESRDKFVAVNFGWRFSSRTNVTGNYGRRFYGRSADFSLNHNVRKRRTSITYSETVTNFSRLIASNLSVGGIVCPIGFSDFTQCFIPETLDYQLQPGEEFTSLNLTVPEISEQTILRKNFTFNTNYRFRKLNLTFTANKSDTDYLGGSREDTRLNLTLAANYDLSRKITLSWSNNFGKYEDLNLETEAKTTDDIWTSTLSSSYQTNQNLTTSLSLRYSKKESELVERNYDGLRASLSMNYRF